MPAEVVVVGGGIAGCTVAYELARRGLRVVLVERDSIAEAASGRNMGLLLNQTEPEVVRIMRRSLDVYRELLPGPVGFDLRETKQLLFAADEAQLASVRSRSAEIAAIGVEVEEVGEMDLPFEMRCVGGFIVHNAWALEPADATRAFAEAARQAGAELRVGVRAGHVQVASGRVHGVVTDAGPLACDAVVLAAGPWITQLWPSLEVSAGRGWLLRLRKLDLDLPWVIEEMAWPDQDELGRATRAPTLGEVAAGYDRSVAGAFVICQLPAGDALLGTSLSPSLRDAYEGLEMPSQVARRAVEIAPGLAGVGVAAAWFGLRPMTPDGMPIVGPLEAEGLYAHGGHGSIGMMAAPATARWLAAAMSGEAAPELAGLRPGRFQE